MRANSTTLFLLATGAALTASAHAQINLQNATATFSQSFDRPWSASEMIDGSTAVRNGWAIFRNTSGDDTLPETAVFETVSDFTGGGLEIDMIQNYSTSPGHLVGRFRWSYTTDNRANFADGLQSGGDVTANWTVLTPTSVSVPVGMGYTILGDGSVLTSIANTPTSASYKVGFLGGLTSVTGLRLEVLNDNSLPTGGPGHFSTNGNFVLTEVNVNGVVPEPATFMALGAGALALLKRRRKG